MRLLERATCRVILYFPAEWHALYFAHLARLHCLCALSLPILHRKYIACKGHSTLDSCPSLVTDTVQKRAPTTPALAYAGYTRTVTSCKGYRSLVQIPRYKISFGPGLAHCPAGRAYPLIAGRPKGTFTRRTYNDHPSIEGQRHGSCLLPITPPLSQRIGLTGVTAPAEHRRLCLLHSI